MVPTVVWFFRLMVVASIIRITQVKVGNAITRRSVGIRLEQDQKRTWKHSLSEMIRGCGSSYSPHRMAQKCASTSCLSIRPERQTSMFKTSSKAAHRDCLLVESRVTFTPFFQKTSSLL